MQGEGEVVRLQTKLQSCRDHGFEAPDIHPFIPQLFIEPLLCAGTVDMTENKTVETSALRELISSKGDKKRPCKREKGDGGRAGEGRGWSGRVSPRRPNEGGHWAPCGRHCTEGWCPAPWTWNRRQSQGEGSVVGVGGAPEHHTVEEAPGHGLMALGGGVGPGWI